ncbi:MAG: hypothetical protein ACFFEL_08485 [Candidatus Thorarchaeota archaeon]
MNLRALRGRDQKGLCFVSTDTDSGIFKMEFNGKVAISDIRPSEKVPTGTIIIDSRLSELLEIDEGCRITLELVQHEIPVCNEIRLAVTSKRDLDNQKVAHAMSKRIDDFQEFIDGLILQEGQDLFIPKLGLSLCVLSMTPTESSTKSARISWNQLLKIRLAPSDSEPYNLCIIVETAAATQIVDVLSGDQKISRHEAILSSLQKIEAQFTSIGKKVLFAGMAFSDTVFHFKTFDSETGVEVERTSIHSSSLIGAYREWVKKISEDNLNLPSNPGEALKESLIIAQSLSESNNLPTAILLFSSGIYTAGQNPVKISRIHGRNSKVMIFAFSMGIKSEIDIMEAIAKEGVGAFVHIDNIRKLDEIIDTIDRRLILRGDID